MQQRHEAIETSTPLPSEETLKIEAEEQVAEAQETIVSDAELADLIACVQAGSARRGRRSKQFMKANLAIGAGAMAIILICLFAFLNIGRHGGMSGGTLIAMVSVISVVLLAQWASIGGGLAWLWKDRGTPQEIEAMHRLMALDDVRVVAPLLDTGSLLRTAPLQADFWRAMRRLLPRMSEEEIQQLGTKRQSSMAAWIHAWDSQINRKMFAEADPAFLLALLPVMAKIGRDNFQIATPPVRVNISLLPILKRWEQGKGAGADPAVQEAARVCREEIERRMALERTGEQLLRAADAAPIARDQLLHPVQETSQTNPRELLRPGGSREQDN